MTYDIMNRLLRQEVSCADSSANVLTQYAYTLIGNRKSMSSGNSTTNYVYDDLGRLQRETESNGIVKEYTYDAANNRKTNIITQNGALVSNISYEYDKMNRLEYVMEGNSLAAAYTYDENGNRKSLSYANGNSTEYQYNYANKVVSLINKQETQAISTFSYLYYLDGNKASKTDDAGTTYYTYDGLGRLKNERLADNSTISYWFDDYSNRAGMNTASPTGTTTTRYIYDKNNRLINEKKIANDITDMTYYYYDNNGNQTFKTSEIIRPVSMDDKASYKAYVMGETEDNLAEAYEYDGLNRLSKAIVSDMTINYTYNGNGLRTSKTVNGITTTHIWDGDQMVLELDGTGNVSSKYIRGINLLYSDRAGIKNFYMYNAHGDVEQLTDATGNVVKSYEYDAFGVEKNPDPADNNPFRYCGEYWDAETASIYLRARYYSPSIGRFISEDPIRDGSNWYIYAYNNPLKYIDPYGLSGIKSDGSYYITHPLDEQLLKLKQEYGSASAERQKQITIEALNIRNSGVEGVDWSVRSDRSLNYYIIDTDVTDKLNNLMKTAGDENFWKRFADLNPITNAARYADFAWMVRPGGQYDLKSKSEWQGKEHFIYNGKVIWYDDPGNILYGYLGKAMGFGDLTLYSAAGAVQITTGTSSWSYVSSFFDDPRDQKSIKMGIQRYKDTKSWIWW